jgi:putative intracellular protease/amidase
LPFKSLAFAKILGAIQIDKYDAVIFVGGSGSEIYFDHKIAQQIAREAYSKNKLLRGICIV